MIEINKIRYCLSLFVVFILFVPLSCAYSMGSRSKSPCGPFIPPSFATPREKILYFEALYKEDQNHYLAYELAHLYLQVGALNRAEEVLRDDLDRRLDPFDAYESYSY